MCPRRSVVSTLYDPMDYSPPGSSVHGIFWTKILEYIAISYPRVLQRIFLTPGSKSEFPASPTVAGRFFTTELPGKPYTKWLYTHIIKV